MIVLTFQPNYFLAIDADVGTASSDTRHEVVAEISRRKFYHAADQTRRHSRPIASGSTGTAPVYINHVSLRSTDGKARGLRGFVLPEVSRLWRKFLGPFDAARCHFSALLLVEPAEQPSGSFSKCFRSFSSVLRHVDKHDAGDVQGVGRITQAVGKFTHERH